MSKTLKATLIWKIKLSQYKGSAHFFGELCQHLDAVNFEFEKLEVKDAGEFKKISADVEISYSDKQQMMNEEQMVDYITVQLMKTQLPCTYFILIDAERSEFNNLQPA